MRARIFDKLGKIGALYRRFPNLHIAVTKVNADAPNLLEVVCRGDNRFAHKFSMRTSRDLVYNVSPLL